MRRLAALLSVGLAWNQAQGEERRMIAVNLDASEQKQVEAAAGSRPLLQKPDDFQPEVTSLVLWEATDGKETNLNPPQLEKLEAFLRNGGGLLLTLNGRVGKSAFRAAEILPTTAWHTLIQDSWRGQADGPMTAARWDESFFPAKEPEGFRMNYHWKLQPFHVAERGAGRYEQFSRPIMHLGLRRGVWEPFFTRPLLNRDWTVRVWGEGVEETPLLITGRYGSGRVAVAASSFSTLPQPLLKRLLDWLGTPPVQERKDYPKLTITSRAQLARRELEVELGNPSAEAVSVQIIGRLLTWENALIGDVVRPVQAPANGRTMVSLPLPAINDTTWQALAYRDAFVVRLGVLSVSGHLLLHEERVVVDLTPGLRVETSLDNLHGQPYPFHAPGYDGQDRNFRKRMGTPTMAYAYPVGKPITAAVVLINGRRNLAPQAVVADETTPLNPTVPMLTDGQSEWNKQPRDGYEGWGMWRGTKDAENHLSFTFAEPAWIAAVTLTGSPDAQFNADRNNPTSILLELDGKPVLTCSDLSTRFPAERGLVRLELPQPVTGRQLRLRLTPGTEPPILGEVEIEGAWTAPTQAAKGELVVRVEDGLNGKVHEIARKTLELSPGVRWTESFTFTPAGDPERPAYLRLQAVFSTENTELRQEQPFLVLTPKHSLLPAAETRSPVNIGGFIVTKGFSAVFPLGTGTREAGRNWGGPDDLVWAYSRGLKQTYSGARTRAELLYASEHDFRHYATPWTSFANGEFFYDVAPARLVERLKGHKQWQEVDQVQLPHSDRWDTGPANKALYTWQEMIAFDEYLAGQKMPRLQGRTRQELADDINKRFFHRWQAWQMERYARAIRNLREAFAREGKRVVITAQGMPLVPEAYQAEIAEVVQGMSDDSTWGMMHESIPFTTGRQMATMAINPVWKLATPLVVGYDSAILNNPHWYCNSITTEPTRRHYYDRAWRGIVAPDGSFRSIHTFGYTMNGYGPWTMSPNDWQEAWRLQERHSLLYPEAPFGAGVIVSTSAWNDPERLQFSGGGMGGSHADGLVDQLAESLAHLHRHGLGVSFTSNVSALRNWKETAPLVLLDISNFTAADLPVLDALLARGVPLAAIRGATNLPGDIAAWLGVPPEVGPTGSTVLQRGVLILPGAAGSLTSNQLAALHAHLQLPVVFPRGVAGYGFRMQGRFMIVLEDWKEEGRFVDLRVRATPGAQARACNVNDHKPLAVHRDGDHWVISVPLRPGEGVLVALEEVTP